MICQFYLFILLVVVFVVATPPPPPSPPIISPFSWCSPQNRMCYIMFTVIFCLHTSRHNTAYFSKPSAIIKHYFSAMAMYCKFFNLAWTANRTQDCSSESSLTDDTIINFVTDARQLPLVTTCWKELDHCPASNHHMMGIHFKMHCALNCGIYFPVIYIHVVCYLC